MARYTYTNIYNLSANAIFASSDTASELSGGLCPPIRSSTWDVSIAQISGVVSEYAIRENLENIENGITVSAINLSIPALSGELISFFKEFDDSTKTANYKSITVHPKYTNRVAVTSVNNDTALRIDYRGERPGTYKFRTANEYTQGGQYFMMSFIPPSGDSYNSVVPAPWINLPYYSNDEFIYYLANGVCNENYQLPIMSHAACNAWTDSEMSITKLGVKIPIDNAFLSGGQIMYVGTDYNETTNTLDNPFGYFYTATRDEIINGRTVGTVEAGGEWRPFYYLGNLRSKHYDYFESSETVYLSASNTILGRGPGNSNYDKDIMGEFYGSILLKIWFDKVNYLSGDLV